MIYRICECQNKDGESVITILDDVVTEAEFDEYYRYIRELNFFIRIDFFMEMIRYNGRTLELHIKSASAASKKDGTTVLKLANKYVFDFAAAIGSFIEYIEKKLMTKQSDQVQKEFAEFRKNMFADDIYKFWYYFRNYTIHYDIPFTQLSSKLVGTEIKTEIICKRDHLLEYGEWKHAKEYVKSLPENVDICRLTEQILVKLHAYYLSLLYIFRDTIVKEYRHVEQFVLRHQARKGMAIMAYETEDDFIANRNGRLHLLHIDRVSELLHDLSMHPNVNVTFTSPH